MSKKNFFITGANSGFGLAIATAAIADGHTVIGTVRSEASRAKVEELLPAAHTVLCDVTEFDRIPNVVEHVENEYGPVDVLINNAGYGHEGVLEESSLEEMDVSLTSTSSVPSRSPRRSYPVSDQGVAASSST